VRRRRTALTVLIGLVIGLSPGVPALASSPADIDALVTDYFVQADQAWYGTTPQAFSAGRLRSGRIAPAARHLAITTASIARDARAELGLMAEDISTLVTNVETAASENRYEFDSSVSTSLAWNVGELGDSVLADDYSVVVTRQGGGWTVSGVTLDAPPPESEEPDPEPEPPVPPCKPGEVCDGETLSLPAGLDLSAGRAKARAMQRAGTDEEQPVIAPAVRYYDATAAGLYAHYWSGVDRFNNPLYNPAYPRMSNDCTNFASQALRAGGWNIKDGWDKDNPKNWTPDLNGPRGPSKAWSVSGWLRSFGVIHTDRAHSRGQEDVADAVLMWNMVRGDLYFFDWDPNGRPDGTIDHTMVVTGTFSAPSSPDFREPIISQHSNHRHNVPLYIQIKRATASVDGKPPEHSRITVYNVRPNPTFNS
jgi:hypothetical protein